jgi:DnaK suppressor protein
MRATKLDRYKSQLQTQLTMLVGQAEGTVTSMEVDASLFPDPTDRATLEEERGFELRLRDRDRKLIKKIKEALQRIDDGTFGVCSECSQKIGEARLRLRPVTTLCLECKEEEERREKRG